MFFWLEKFQEMRFNHRWAVYFNILIFFFIILQVMPTDEIGLSQFPSLCKEM